jgi:DNA end-binding protein Ku
MAPRANWKGYLKIDEIVCPVALFSAASTSERIAFHILNRKTGNRVHRQLFDDETGKPVEFDDQLRGYERAPGDYVMIEPETIAAAIPESDKTLSVQAFIRCDEVDDLYFDRPYYLTPGSPAAHDDYALIREGMRARKVAAIARTVLFRRMRTVLVRARGAGLVAATLNFNYEIRSPEDAFRDIPKAKIDKEMLDLAIHIIATKRGEFDPHAFDDRYEAALADVVRAKLEGRALPVHKPPAASNVVDLMDALRRSAEGSPRVKSTSEKPAGKTSAKVEKAAPKKTRAPREVSKRGKKAG